MAVQVIERTTLGWSLSAYGSTYDVLSRSKEVAHLSQYMKPPPRSLLDDALLSPMPGTLLSLSVAEGDSVFVGQELCIVEAMKMQNVLHATRDGVVKELLAQPGTTCRPTSRFSCLRSRWRVARRRRRACTVGT